MLHYIESKITRKISFGIAILIFSSLLVGLFSLWSAQKNKQRLTNMFEQEVAGLEEADDIKSALYRIRSDSLEYILAARESTRIRLKNEINKQQARLRINFKKLYNIGLNKQEKKFITDIKHYSDLYISMLENTLYQAVEHGKLTQAEDIARHEAVTKLRLARAAANDFMAYSVRRAMQRQINMESDYTIFMWIMVVSFMLIAIIALIILGYFQRNIARPITQMTNAMRKLAQRDWSASIPAIDRTDELGAMAAAVKIFKENGIENEKLAAAEIAKEKAEARIKAQSSFMSSMSHELRTPMNAILGFAQILESSTKDPLTEKQKTHIGYIIDRAMKLMELIEQVLALEKIKDKKVVFSSEWIKVEVICRECLLLVEKQAQARNLRLETKLDAGCQIQADEDYLKLVIYNLLTNAVKYSDEASTVFLECRHVHESKIRISVNNSGDGIAKNVQNKIFEPFNRAGKEDSNILGAGVGLTIAKHLTGAMNGRIGVESDKGEGCSFWVEFSNK